jgi:hypothetical protein
VNRADTIAKLRRLAADPGATEAEREAAARKAAQFEAQAQGASPPPPRPPAPPIAPAPPPPPEGWVWARMVVTHTWNGESYNTTSTVSGTVWVGLDR